MPNEPDVPAPAEGQEPSPAEPTEGKATVSDDAKPSKDRGFSDHPRFQELVTAKNEALKKSELQDEQIATLQEKLGALEPKTEKARLTDEEVTLTERIYPGLRDQIFQEAQEREAQRLKQVEAKQLEEDERQSTLDTESQQMVTDIKDEIGDDAEFDKFKDFAVEFVKRFPGVDSVTPIFEEYKSRGLLPSKGDKVVSGTGGGTTDTKTQDIRPGESMLSAGKRAQRARGMT